MPSTYSGVAVVLELVVGDVSVQLAPVIVVLHRVLQHHHPHLHTTPWHVELETKAIRRSAKISQSRGYNIVGAISVITTSNGPSF